MRARRLHSRLLWAALLGAALFSLLVGFAFSSQTFQGQLRLLWHDVRFAVVALYSPYTERAYDTADFAPVRHTGVNPLGINTFFDQEADLDRLRRSFELIRDGGFGWIRQQIPWADVERSGKGNFRHEIWNVSTWEKYDRIVDLAAEHGLRVIARIDSPPRWARRAFDERPLGPPDRYEDYGDFVALVARRYRGRVSHYQIWNEPNLTIEWGNGYVSASEYVRLLEIAAARIRAEDPSAVIILAGLAPTVEMGPENVSDVEFLRQIYEAGGRDYFDIVSVNPYGLRSGPYDRRARADEINFSRPLLAREVMVQYGDESKPIWASELGWNALPLDFPDPPTHGQVSRAQQARYTDLALRRARREWPWLGVMNLWHFRFMNGNPYLHQAYHYGFVSEDLRPYPVYDAVKALAQEPPALYPGYHQEDHYAIRYRGTWSLIADPGAVLGQLTRATEPLAPVATQTPIPAITQPVTLVASQPLTPGATTESGLLNRPELEPGVLVQGPATADVRILEPISPTGLFNSPSRSESPASITPAGPPDHSQASSGAITSDPLRRPGSAAGTATFDPRQRPEQPTATVTFDFVGSAVDLVVPRGPDAGRLQVELDGSIYGLRQLSVGGGRAELDLRGPAQSAVIPLVSGLQPGRHTLELTLVPGTGELALDGIIVRDGPGINQPLRAALLATTLLLGLLATAHRPRRP
ncbi:MAG: cellulase family glycosylhydrolase [Chloroflexi bacterium]|nr:cellulase family glycosylhydrolase [Chloroflexota bacterium]